jgi:sterol O-acyltransferase
MQINDYKTIYNMVAASFVPLTIMIVVDNLNRYGELLDLDTFNSYFSRTDKTFICWWLLAFINYTVVPLVYFVVKAKLNRWLWVPLYLVHQAVLLCVPSMFVEQYKPGFGNCMVIMIEGVRMMMKSHSYLRNKLLYCTDNPYKDLDREFTKDKEYKRPVFSVEDISMEIRRYSYFFVSPTLVYRDSYTLTSKRSFTRAFIHFGNFLICLYYCTWWY